MMPNNLSDTDWCEIIGNFWGLRLKAAGLGTPRLFYEAIQTYGLSRKRENGQDAYNFNSQEAPDIYHFGLKGWATALQVLSDCGFAWQQYRGYLPEPEVQLQSSLYTQLEIERTMQKLIQLLEEYKQLTKKLSDLEP